MIRERADIINDCVRHTDDMLNQYINDSLKRLQAIFLKKGLVKIQRVHEPTVDGSTDYALPDDYLATVGVWYVESQGTSRLREMDDIERALQTPLDGTYGSRYRIFELGEKKGDSLTNKRIEFYPNPSSGTYKHVYVPVLTFSADTDSIDDVLGWHEYVVLDVAVKIYTRDNLDPSTLVFEREKWEKAIEDEVEARYLNSTYTVNDVYDQMGLTDAADKRFPWYPDFYYNNGYF